MKPLLPLLLLCATAWGQTFSGGATVSGQVGMLGTVSTPVDSPGTGSYGSAQTVTITATNSSSIYYTVNGTTPDCTGTGTLYSGGFTSPGSTFTLKAIGCNTPLWTASSVSSSVYTISATPPVWVQGTAWVSWSAAGAQTVSFAGNATVGHSIAVGIIIDGTATISSVSHSTDTCTATTNSPLSYTYPEAGKLYWFLCPTVASTSKDLTVTQSGTSSKTIVTGQEYTAVSAVDQTPAGNEGNGTAVASNTATTTVAAEVLLGLANTSATPTITGTFAVPAHCPASTSCSNSNWWNNTIAEQIVTATGTYQVTSSNTVNWATLLVTLK